MNRIVATATSCAALALLALVGGLDGQEPTEQLRDIFSVSVRTEGEVLEPRRSGEGFSMTADQVAWGDGS